MKTLTSVLGGILCVAAFVALHLIAAAFVLLYVLVVGAAGLSRWCWELLRGPHRHRRVSAAVAAAP